METYSTAAVTFQGVGKGVAQVARTETIFLSVVFGHFADKATLFP